MCPTATAIQAALGAEEARLGATNEGTVEMMASLSQDTEQYIVMNKDREPLAWWQDHQHLYPNLVAFAV